MCCGGSRLHKASPEKGSAVSAPRCLLQLQFGGQRGTWSLQISRLQARQGRESQRAPKATTERAFSSSQTISGSLWTALRGSAMQQHTATATTSSAPGCTGLPHYSGGNKCPASLQAQPTASTNKISQFRRFRHLMQTGGF